MLVGLSGGAELLAVALLQRDKVAGVDGAALVGVPWQRMIAKHSQAVAADVTRVPTLIVNARDDPVYGKIDDDDPAAWGRDCDADVETLAKVPGVVLAYADAGSHCAFVEGWSGASSWSEDLVVAFCEATAARAP